MRPDKESQNTFILVAIILVVCLSAIIAILGGIISLVREPLGTITDEVGEFFRRAGSYDYNFEIPKIEENTIVQESTQEETKEETPRMFIEIKKIDLYSEIFASENPQEVFRNGFWIAPISNEFGIGEVLLFCHRTAIPFEDTRSCYDINTLGNQDLITIKVNDIRLEYSIISSSIVKMNDEKLYELDENRDMLRIVSFIPEDTSERIIILAERKLD